MPIFLLSFMMVFSWSQTRPTGGTGPDVDEQFTDLTALSMNDLFISQTVEKNYARCGLMLPQPKDFNIYQVYLLLNSLSFLNTFKTVTFKQNSTPVECLPGSVSLDPMMRCLLQGSEENLTLFMTTKHAKRYLEKEYKLKPKEASDMSDFLFLIHSSLEARPVKK